MDETQSQKTTFSIGRLAQNLVLAALDLYALGLIVQVALMPMPQRLWFVEMVANLLHWMLLAAIPILILLLMLRRWRRAALWAIPTLAFVVLYGELFLPSMPTASACNDCIPLRVMSFNPLGESRPDMQIQIDTIRESGADIVAFQELSPETAALIEEQLADLYPYRALYPHGIPGTGIISKYPLRDAESFHLLPNTLYHSKATIEVNEVPILVISAHPPPPGFGGMRFGTRGADNITALAAMASEGGPTLLIGDFNITDQSADYHILAASGLHDTYREVGWGFGATWPSRMRHEEQPALPLIRPDYIWHTDHFRAVSAWVGPWAKSDHRPVIADLIFAP